MIVVAKRLEDVFPGLTPGEYEKLKRMDLPIGETIGRREITPEENKMVEDHIKMVEEKLRNHTG